jgi:uncharacterized protein (TIGR02246 family)
MASRKPGEIHEEFERRFAAGDIDGIMSLYEPEAVFVGKDGQVARGKAAIREAVAGFLPQRPSYSQEIERVLETDGVALITTSWSIEIAGTNTGDTDASRFPTAPSTCIYPWAPSRRSSGAEGDRRMLLLGAPATASRRFPRSGSPP